MGIIETTRKWLGGLTLRKATPYHENPEPIGMSRWLDVDRVAMIFQSAEAGSTQELFSLYRDMMIADGHAQSEWAKRKLAVLGKQISATPEDDKNPNDRLAAEFVETNRRGCSGFLQALGHLLDSTLYPVAVAEKVYSAAGGVYSLAELVPVPHRMLDLSHGDVRIYSVDSAGKVAPRSHVADADRYIVHRGHLLGAPDCFGGPMRSIVIWWLLSAMDRGWWARFLERFGAPFLVGKYDQSDDASRRTLESAFSFATKIGGLVVSRETQVELQQAAASASGDSYEKFLAVCQREKSKIIIGQTLSAESQSTGLGSGVASAHEAVRDDIREFDAMMLGETLRTQLFAQLLSINGMAGAAPTITFGGESAQDASLTGAMLTGLAQAGLRVKTDGLEILSQRLGLPVEYNPTPQNGGLPPAAFSAPEPGGSILPAYRVARAAAPEIAAAFRGELEPVARIVTESQSARECLGKLQAFTAGWRPSRSAELIAMALNAYALNGVAVNNLPGK